MKAVIVNDIIGLITGIDEDGYAVAEFGGSYQLQISKQGDVWKVTNGVNGYGNNCRDEFKDATVTPLYESPAPDGWVRVEEGLPSEHRRFLCIMFSINCFVEEVCLFEYSTKKWMFQNKYVTVTHYQPLPQPPKQ